MAHIFDAEGFILSVCQRLREEDFAFSIKLAGPPWDIYHYFIEEKDSWVTIGFKMEGKKAVIGLFKKGRLTEKEAYRELEHVEGGSDAWRN